ncbi:unnamed protein product [Owenia fusiformis]|uniref:Nondiscriminating glutamyl-tRNA synthetase EARS2, mitochondrial n=1 Tax=Owenia fusiformis TaxID=6347 RepID=A0A8J1T4N1_OWEFU|nr:unnamed protein product [Owenia fusiformis]
MRGTTLLKCSNALISAHKLGRHYVNQYALPNLLSRGILVTHQNQRQRSACFTCGNIHRIGNRNNTANLYNSSKIHTSCSRQNSDNGPVRVRFAPSPTGMLHIGGLRTAVYNFLLARKKGGEFILRIEDTDRSRFVPGAVEMLTESLKWAGIHPDEGPGIGGNYGPYVQSERLDIYQENIKTLLENGSAYRCFCTPKRLELLRKEHTRRKEIPKYDNRCRHISDATIQEKLDAKTPHVIRFKLAECVDSWHDVVLGPRSVELWKHEGDPVLMKSDGFPTYHLANVIDDHAMSITHVLRGEEWYISTPKHLQLYKAFGWDPPEYAHLPLLLNSDGSKLSKRNADVDVESYKKKDIFPMALINFITSMGGGFTEQHEGMWSLDELIQRFDITKLNSHSCKVDFERLQIFNRFELHRHLESPSERMNLVASVRSKLATKYPNEIARTLSAEEIIRIVKWAKDRIHTLDDLIGQSYSYIWARPLLTLKDIINETECDEKTVMTVLKNTLSTIRESQFDAETLNSLLRQQGKMLKEDVKFKDFMKILRTSLTGSKEGPPVAEVMLILEKKETCLRLDYKRLQSA